MWLNILILALYVAMMVFIAFYTRRKVNTLNDFFLAGKGVGGWLSAFAYGTTYFSAVIFVGYAGKFGASFGLASVWIGVGNAILGTLLAWKVLARRTKRMTTELGSKTMPEFFEARYESPKIKLVSAIVIFIFLIPYSASVYQGLGYLFEIVFGIPFVWCIVIMAALTGLYLVFGGYLATALTDFVQGFIMIVGVAVMVVMIVLRPEVNIAELFEQGKGFLPAAGGSGFLDSPLLNVIVLILLTSFGVWGVPQTVHKFYAIKDEPAIKKGTVISTVFALVVGFGAYFAGAMVNFFEHPSANPDTFVPDMLKVVLPNGLIGLIVVLLLSASMSTLSSLSLAGSSAIAVDAYKGYIRPNSSDKRVTLVMRLGCLFFVVVSAVLAIGNFDAIVTMMSLSWGTLAGCFIGPYVYGLTSRRVTRAAAYASIVSGIAVTVILVVVLGFVSPAPGLTGAAAVVKGGIARSPLIGVVAMAVSMIVVPVVSAFTKKPSDELLARIFPKK